MRAKKRAWLSAIFIIVSLGGCTLTLNVRDKVDFTSAEAETESSRTRYERASQRYEELNEFVGEETGQVAEELWVKNGVSSGVLPKDGGGMGNYLRGADQDNSYYFEALRMLPDTTSIHSRQLELQERWRERGWAVKQEESDLDGTLRIEAITDKGYWIAADEEDDGLYITAHTPPYWGTYLPLADDIHERYLAEKARGEHPRFDVEEDEQILLLPGDYRPFPRWDAVD